MAKRVRAIIIESNNSMDVAEGIIGYMNGRHSGVETASDVPVVSKKPTSDQSELSLASPTETIPVVSLNDLKYYKSGTFGWGFIRALSNSFRNPTDNEIVRYVNGYKRGTSYHITKHTDMVSIIRHLINYNGRLSLEQLTRLYKQIENVTDRDINEVRTLVYAARRRSCNKAYPGIKVPIAINVYTHNVKNKEYVVLASNFVQALLDNGITEL